MTPLSNKSTIGEIRARFDNEVERFSLLETGQQATLDAPLVLDLVARAASTHLKPNDRILDVGCGAGNFTLRLLREAAPLHCNLVDLSEPMLKKAEERIRGRGVQNVTAFHSDLRSLVFPDASFDCILAGAVLHHLRDDNDWCDVFKKLCQWLKPGGVLYVSDLVFFDSDAIQSLMWNRYGDYLKSLGGEEYREKVFAYIDREDSPRSLPFQLDLLKNAGFRSYDVLHRNSVFACYYGQK